ncbi:MAG: DUF3822 family protein [Flavobacteriales bacterium]
MSTFIPEIAARALMPRELLADASAMHLCMHAGPGAVCVAVAQAGTTRALWSQTFATDAGSHDAFHESIQFILDRNWADKVFRKCTFTFDTLNFCVVPSALFERGKEKELLQFHTGKQHKLVQTAALNEMQAELVYEQMEHYTTLVHRFVNVRVVAAPALLARAAHMLSQGERHCIHIAHHAGQLTLCILHQNQLQLLNAYQAKSTADVLYFTANAAMQLGIDLENAQLMVHSHHENEELTQLLSDYNRNVKQAAPTGQSAFTHMHLLCA